MKLKPIYARIIITLIISVIVIGILLFTTSGLPESSDMFDGNRSYQDVKYQVSLGPRTPGSVAHQNVTKWLMKELEKNNWDANTQSGQVQDHLINNIIAKKGSGHPIILIGAHYDSRMQADKDPDPNNREQAVPGANDGASGVAVLLELSRVLSEPNSGQIWLVFFDAEDQGKLPGWGWILGSRYFVSQLQEKPDSVVIIDMIGDIDLNIYLEKNSNQLIRGELWAEAEKLNYDSEFISQEKFSMLDDHTPFLEEGYPSALIIDFDYPYWHTTNDTLDKISSTSLQVVGRTIQSWITEKIY